MLLMPLLLLFMGKMKGCKHLDRITPRHNPSGKQSSHHLRIVNSFLLSFHLSARTESPLHISVWLKMTTPPCTIILPAVQLIFRNHLKKEVEILQQPTFGCTNHTYNAHTMLTKRRKSTNLILVQIQFCFSMGSQMCADFWPAGWASMGNMKSIPLNCDFTFWNIEMECISLRTSKSTQ